MTYGCREPRHQRDEYYDDLMGSAEQLDFVVRLRIEGDHSRVAMKGPRFYSAAGEYSRLEFEVSAGELNTVRKELTAKGLVCRWFFEKRRAVFHREGSRIEIAIDEIPKIGFYIEIEGPLEEVRILGNDLEEFLGAPDRRNYSEIFRAHQAARGVDLERLSGAAFDDEPQ
jgi:adenylate cyclase class IV